ncbi:MAG: hypothetical protein AB1626_00985 [Candidatus Micrarchaeota archaeon]
MSVVKYYHWTEHWMPFHKEHFLVDEHLLPLGRHKVLVVHARPVGSPRFGSDFFRVPGVVVKYKAKESPMGIAVSLVRPLTAKEIKQFKKVVEQEQRKGVLEKAPVTYW